MFLPTLLAAMPAVDGATLSLDADLYDIDQPIGVTVTGDPGDRAWILLSSSVDSVELPGLGTVGVSLTDGLLTLDLGYIPAGGVLEVDCDITCDSPLLQEPCYLQAVTIDVLDPQPICFTEVVVLQGASADCNVCAADPTGDAALSADPRDWGLDLTGIGFAERLRFTQGGEFAESPDGTARLSGIVAADDDPTCTAYVDLLFDSRVQPLDANHPPAGNPVLGLNAGAYVDQGGSINPDNWHYYELATGSLIGLDGCLAGARVALSVGGAAAQVGVGANNSNGEFGLEAELVWHVETQPTTGQLEVAGVANLRADTRGCFDDGELLCPTVSLGSPEFCPVGGGRAVWLSDASIGDGTKKYVFVDTFGEFVEFEDGTAILRGEVMSINNPNRRFFVDVLFFDRVAPGDGSYPPAGSPKVTICDEFLLENGGTIDTDTYVYYETFTGLLTGLGELEGAQLAIERRGEAFQVGEAASLDNPFLGMSGWFDVAVLAQPTTGVHIDEHVNGDFNMNLEDCPEPLLPTDGLVCAYDFDAQTGATAFDTVGNLDLAFNEGNGALEWVDDERGTGVEFDQGSNGTARLHAGDSSFADELLAELIATGEFTVQTAALMTEDSRDDARLVSWSDSTTVTERNFSLMAYPADGNDIETEFRIVTSDGSDRFEYELPGSYAPGQFVVYAMTYDGTVLRGYADGDLVVEEVLGGDLSGFESRSFQLGNENTLNRAFDGVIYDVKIWNRALGTGELVDQSAGLHAGA